MEYLTLKIKNIIEENNIFKKGEKVLVAVSGGPDSVFLINVLRSASLQYRLRLFVGCLNHGLRAKESDSEQIFVEKLARDLNAPFFTAKVDTRRFARKHKLSIEDAARNLRHDFFFDVCRQNKLKKVVLAHTRDDQIETIMMRILRGAGMSGLCGMRLENRFKDIAFVRPLLPITKKEILAYLKNKNIKYRADSSNLKTEHFRNMVRLKILPFLERFNPKFGNNLFRIGETQKELSEFVTQKLSSTYSRLVKKQAVCKLKIKRGAYLKTPALMRRELLREIFKAILGTLSGIDFRHLQITEDFIRRAKAGAARYINLPKHLVVELLGEEIIFYKMGEKNKKIAQKKRKLYLNRKLDIERPRCWLLAKKIKKRLDIKKHSKFVEYFDRDKLSFPLIVRARQDGDIFFPLGTGGKKKLKKFFIDEKIAKSKRDEIPLIVKDKDIVWVVGMRISEKYKVDADTKCIIGIRVGKR
ncbi:MAG: tRNA lysidine(34) synthetase TilS [Candidatus Omnitrophica bacterium]|nr:tRNA lysidine(34) synthetase TilS [Candidatus Omnitrophota bacterium]MBU1926126.1 tRNA lysidine(34) synthetase TilS [Candidatus Omnitrophota bacterium]